MSEKTLNLDALLWEDEKRIWKESPEDSPIRLVLLRMANLRYELQAFQSAVSAHTTSNAATGTCTITRPLGDQ
jgi:hypothetical protein